VGATSGIFGKATVSFEDGFQLADKFGSVVCGYGGVWIDDDASSIWAGRGEKADRNGGKGSRLSAD
jgi:hypothetical protein